MHWLHILAAALPFILGTRAHSTPVGVQPDLAIKYTPKGDTWTCLDGSATIPWKAVNDDYCDCKDGSDEPGTSACPNSIFYCSNVGHLGSVIPSSRVNDGLCGACRPSAQLIGVLIQCVQRRNVVTVQTRHQACAPTSARALVQSTAGSATQSANFAKRYVPPAPLKTTANVRTGQQNPLVLHRIREERKDKPRSSDCCVRAGDCYA